MDETPPGGPQDSASDAQCRVDRQERLPDVANFIFAHSRVLHWGPYVVRNVPEGCAPPFSVADPTPASQSLDSSEAARESLWPLKCRPASIYVPSRVPGSTTSVVNPVIPGFSRQLDLPSSFRNNNEEEDQCLDPYGLTLFRSLVVRELDEVETESMKRYIASASVSQLVASGLTPTFYASVVEWNIVIAVKLLERLIDTPDDALYLNQLLCQSPQTPMHLLKCLRVVSDVSAGGSVLPSSFLSRFIYIAFHICSHLQERLAQQRVARLICVFLLGLVQRSIVKPTDDIVAEIQSFAVTWIRLKEAGDLFRALRQSTACQRDD